MKRQSLLALLLTTAFVLPAFAGPSAEALGTCLAESTTGKDRKELIRWLFVAMASHPEMRPLANVSTADHEQSSKYMAALFTRLVVENCPVQARSAVQSEGTAAMQSAFGTLGKLAMLEVMANQEVGASMSHFERFLDAKSLQAALSPP